MKKNDNGEIGIEFGVREDSDGIFDFDFVKKNFVMKIYDFGDFGCCGPESLGFGKKVDFENFGDFSKIENMELHDFLGKGVILTPIKKTQKKLKTYKTTISLKNSKRKGYYMPITGLTCSSKKNTNKKNNSPKNQKNSKNEIYYYFQILYENDTKLKIKLLTNLQNLNKIEFFENYIIDIYYSQKLEKTLFGDIYEYFSIIDKERDIFTQNGGKDKISLNSFLLGSEIKIYNFFNEKIFSCKLNKKNLDYEEIWNLMYNYKSRSFSTYNADGGFFSYVLISVIIFFLFFVIVGLLCRFKKKKNFDISFERVKVEA